MWTISGNLIGSQNNNIHFTGVRGAVISGNYIYSAHNRNVLVENSRNVVLGPNTFGHNPDYKNRELATGIRFVNSENCNLNGVLIQDAQAGAHTVETVPLEREALVELIRCRRVNMTGCQVLDGTPIGVLIEDCRDALISSCSVIDQRETSKMDSGVVFRGKNPGSMLVQSRVSGARQGSVVGGEDVAIDGNRIG